jgi:hypothetical protein
MGRCIILVSFSLMPASFAFILFADESRVTVNGPVFLVLPQMCVKPRESEYRIIGVAHRERVSALRLRPVGQPVAQEAGGHAHMTRGSRGSVYPGAPEFNPACRGAGAAVVVTQGRLRGRAAGARLPAGCVTPTVPGLRVRHRTGERAVG